MPSATGVRLTLSFNFAQQIRTAGWSESYDLGFADIPTALVAENSIKAFMSVRCACLGIGPVLMEAVLGAYVQPPNPGTPPPRRNTVAVDVPVFPLPGKSYNSEMGGSLNYIADFAPTVYYIKLQTALSGTPVYSRNVWIAGLPDVADETDSNQIVEAVTAKAVEALLSALSNKPTNLAGRCSISVRSIDRSGANPIKQCTNWNLLNNSYTVPAHGFQPNQPINAIGMKVDPGGSAPRGRYLVGAVIDANTITLMGAATPSQPKKTGGFRAAVITFNAVGKASPLGFTKRNKGGPFFQSVGRRRKRVTVPV